jgi:hypothetical protein
VVEVEDAGWAGTTTAEGVDVDEPPWLASAYAPAPAPTPITAAAAMGRRRRKRGLAGRGFIS